MREDAITGIALEPSRLPAQKKQYPTWRPIPGKEGQDSITEVMELSHNGLHAGCLVRTQTCSGSDDKPWQMAVTFVPGATLEMFGIERE